MSSPIIQYVVVRRDLLEVLKWPLGAVITQACHAATAAIYENLSHANTKTYLSEIDRMHKVVLGVENDAELIGLSEKLRQSSIDFKLWVEQPEGINTAIATRPYVKSDVQCLFKGLKLLK